jgi:Concanavalin A-like lectin/glucanases superfamily/PEP-CTERM motif
MDKMNRTCIWSLAVSAFLLFVTPQVGADLIGLYQFNDPNNLGLDTSGMHNNATNFGATYDASGYQGGAASFTSSSGLQSPIDVDPSAMSQMTSGAWVMPTATNPIRAVLPSDDGGFDRDIDIDNRGGTTSWSAFTGSGVLGSGVTPSTSAWTFLAAVYDQSSNSLTYYVNGMAFSTSTSFGGSMPFFDIGNNPGFGENFSGLIDNVFVYNQALTPSEIATIRSDGFPSSVPEPSSLTLLGIAAVGLTMLRRRVISRRTDKN